jgi:translation initiation factor 3 subunit A
MQEEEEARRQEEQARQQMLQEQKRLELEREERERKRQENEIQQIKDRHLKEKMQQISQTSHGQKILKKLNEDVSCHKFVVRPLHNYGYVLSCHEV